MLNYYFPQVKQRCPQCSGTVRDKETKRLRRCQLLAACHKGNKDFCWIHIFQKKPSIVNSIANDMHQSAEISNEELARLMTKLKSINEKLNSLTPVQQP